jgi:hypothetical protein
MFMIWEFENQKLSICIILNIDIMRTNNMDSNKKYNYYYDIVIIIKIQL